VTSDPGHPTGVTGAGGARIYTRGQHHRLFTELSVSQIRTEWVTVDGQTFPGARRYGPGVQVGYQYISRNGLTGLASIGVGYAVGAIPRADSVGLCSDWERDTPGVGEREHGSSRSDSSTRLQPTRISPAQRRSVARCCPLMRSASGSSLADLPSAYSRCFVRLITHRRTLPLSSSPVDNQTRSSVRGSDTIMGSAP
jgi:hypothetical protein